MTSAFVSRCSNCGERGHATQHCNEFGPYFPEPGFTQLSYEEKRQEIMALHAADILAHHEEEHHPSEHDALTELAQLTQELERADAVAVLDDDLGEEEPHGPAAV